MKFFARYSADDAGTAAHPCNEMTRNSFGIVCVAKGFHANGSEGKGFAEKYLFHRLCPRF